jgi:response regulator RpfG family c-di-GMP phosphodiesterase
MKNYVLLIDDTKLDNFINRILIQQLRISQSIIEFQNAKEALGYLRLMSSENKPYPEYIFLDLNMPEMDGFQFIEQFEEVQYDEKESTKIIVVSSTVDPEEIRRVISNPRVHKFIEKPLTKDKLKELVLG